MHEFALAEGVIHTVIKTAEKEHFKEITRIKIMMGELQQIDTEIFEFALKDIIQAENTTFRKTKIELEKEKAILKCRICEHEWLFNEAIKELNEDEAELIHFVPEIAHSYIRCPECNSSDFEVVKGNRVWIDFIEGKP